MRARGWRDAKRNDLVGVVPLCRKCHNEWHTSGPSKMLQKRGIDSVDLAVIATSLLTEFFLIVHSK